MGLRWLGEPGTLPGGALTAGLFNPMHPWSIQVLGGAGAACLDRLAAGDRQRLPPQLAGRGSALLIAAGVAPPADPERWNKAGIGCLQSEAPAHELVYRLRRMLADGAAAHTTEHGVFLDVHGLGVLLTGPSATGKSELALELVSRGHRLIADDAVEFMRPAAGIVLGRCPAVLRGFLEVRGLGLLDVRAMFGDAAVREQQRLDLVIRLRGRVTRPFTAAQRLSGHRNTVRVLSVAVPAISLPARLGHNQAVLVEAACRDLWLRFRGMRAGEAFIARQQQAILTTGSARK